MSILVDQTRRYWLPGINAVSGPQAKQLAGWLADAKYQVLSDIASNKAELTTTDPGAVVRTYAAGASVMASAAFETVEGLTPSTIFPKTVAWLLVRGYYGAYFAAHALLRMFGRSCSHLNAIQLMPIVKTADLYGHATVAGMASGSYLVRVKPSATVVMLERIDAGEGSHAGLWSAFFEFINDIANQRLASGGASAGLLEVSGKLIELRAALTNSGSNARGTWLSHVRNRVNYHLAFGAWHPYDGRQRYYDQLFATLADWRRDPIALQLAAFSGKDIQRFVATCAFIVGFCRAVVVDMADRVPTGPSFHRNHALRVLRLIGPSAAGRRGA